jgi:hypothetical protein
MSRVYVRENDVRTQMCTQSRNGPRWSRDNGSRGRPESVAPEILSWRRTEVKLFPPKVAENSNLAVSSFHYIFVLGEMRRRLYRT